VRLGPEGESLEFSQWNFLADKINFDENLLVRFDPPLAAGKTHRIVIRSAGPLFDTGRLAAEDYWHPILDDQTNSNYELWVTVPKNMRAVGAGALLSEELVEGKRQYHFKTSRPHMSSTFYYGNYESKKGKADEVAVEVFLDRNLPGSLSDIKWALQEVTNAVKVYNRILMPLELDDLRVAGTPTGHGRGFEGLILMSSLGIAASSSGSDLFRAHEVAHQWWGNLVQPKNWPEDRWLSESTAEYSAMEYYTLRYEKPAKTRAQIREQWVQPILRAPDVPFKTLTGEKRKERPSEISPLIAGTGNVYTKGPLVLHMLRYTFQVRQGSDEKFWLSLQDFLEQYKHQQASTEDFIRIVESHMGGNIQWFWDQWLYGRRIPKVRWSHSIEQAGGQWKLVVQAEQEDTEFALAIPVYIELADGRKASSPLIMQGKHGVREMNLPSKPKKVTLNDNYEALVEIVR
jgi:aminopeptidase N